MIKHLPYEEDLALKRFNAIPSDQKPRFAWRDVVDVAPAMSGGVKVRVNGDLRDFDLAEVADTIGNALTDLLLSREEAEIFTAQNRDFVSRVARAVADRLAQQVVEGKPLTLGERDIHLLIEGALIDHHAYDVAKALVLNRVEIAESVSGPTTVRVIRRRGQVVPWDRNKVEIAVRKAFLSLEKDSGPALQVAYSVEERVRSLGQAFVQIEDLQDIVQEELMRLGHFKVAEAYILYRAHRSRLREEAAAATPAVVDTRQESMIVVKRADGSSDFWDGSDLRRRIAFSMLGLDLVLDADTIEAELRRSLHAEMTEDDLRTTIILNSKALMERDADFAKFAGRLLLTFIYEEVLDWQIGRDGIEGLREAHRKGFVSYIQRGIEIERLSPALKGYDLRRLAEALDPLADLEFDYLGIQTLYDRYLIIDKTGSRPRRLETPQYFWMRVAMGLFLREPSDREGWVTKLYSLYKGRRFCSSTPTLFNSGTLHSQLSSCYLYKIDDSIESIMIRGIAENAFLSKWAGGLGGSWTAVRGTGSYIKGTNGESQGVIPFLKLHNDQLVAVNQGGKRKGSGCAYLESWHNDIFDFLELRKNTGDDRRRAHDMNTANWIPDLFMKRFESRGHWTLFRSNETPDLHELYGRAFEARYEEYEARVDRGEMWGRRIPAVDLWRDMLRLLFETGHPWITFKDPCNVRSPQDHAGVIHSSNLCTEITLNTSKDETAVCNLGSVILETHLKADGSLDLEKLGETVRVAVRALDNVIDLNFYPTEAARRSNLRHRPVGLGVMGLQNALYLRGESFASQEAIEFNDEFMEAIAYFAYDASSDLAAERGTYESYKGSKWDRGMLPHDTIDLLEQERGLPIQVKRGGRMDWNPLRSKIRRQGMRNSNVIAIAPTATISNIMGSSPCIEPNYKNLFVKSNLSGDFTVLSSFLVRDLKQRGLWDDEMRDALKYHHGELASIERIPADLRERYKTAFSIPFEAIIDAAARRQKWIDQSQSLNLFLGEPNMRTLSQMYKYAWHAGLKTTYYLRTLQASNIEQATGSAQKEVRGIMARKEDAEAAPAAAPAAKRTFTEAEKAACSIEAMRNGGECEACQ